VTPPAWVAELPAVEQDAVRRLAAAAHRADGVAPLGEAAMRDLSGRRRWHLLAAGQAGLIGYLSLEPWAGGAEATAELVVHPDARGRGVGAALARAAITRTGGEVRFWAHGTLPAARALAARLGLAPVRELIQMSRSLDDLPPEVSVPEGISIRTYAGVRDHEELLRVNNAAFAWHPEQGGWTEEDLTARRMATWFDPQGLFLATDDATGALLGFHWTKVHDGGPDAGVGEVYVLAVDPAGHGRGLGRALTRHGVAHLAGRLAHLEAPRVVLYVESDNPVALATYRGMGFATTFVDTAYGRALDPPCSRLVNP
jgi:mycothiol synthase